MANGQFLRVALYLEDVIFAVYRNKRQASVIQLSYDSRSETSNLSITLCSSPFKKLTNR